MRPKGLSQLQVYTDPNTRTVATFIIAGMEAIFRRIRTCGDGVSLDKDLQLFEKSFSACSL